MCENAWELKATLKNPVIPNAEPYNLIHESKTGEQTILLEGFLLKEAFSYSAIKPIQNKYGVSSGYMIIIGNKLDDFSEKNPFSIGEFLNSVLKEDQIPKKKTLKNQPICFTSD